MNEKASPLAAFLAAVQFLLISPAFIRRSFSPAEMGAAVGFYPLVGIIMGSALIGLDWLTAWLFAVPLSSALLLAAWVILTGALHLDGFLDACDGMLGGFTPESRLEIMRDERRGAYALAAGSLLLLVQYSALNTLGEFRWPALLLAPVLGRWAIALAVIGFPYARSSGLGKDIKNNAHRIQGILASLTTLLTAVAVTWLNPGIAPAAAIAAALLVFSVCVRFTLRRIPGMTGDIYGAINILVETAVLLTFAAANRINFG